MFKTFLKISFRNIAKHKGFALINISGLTLGLASCLLIGLFVWDEKQYDKGIPGADEIYRVYIKADRTEGISNSAGTSPMFAPTLKQEFPEVKESARIMQIQSKSLFEQGNKKLYLEGGIYTEPGFLNIFPLNSSYGPITHALDDPSSVIISSVLANQCFGNVNPIGKQLMIDKLPYQVKAVFVQDPKFHLSLNYILPLQSAGLPPERMQRWGWQQFYTYIKVQKGTDASTLQKKFQDIVKARAYPVLKPMGFTYLPYLQPLKKVHLYSSDFKFDMAVRGNIVYVNALSIIASFILLIACFNFINLTTAKSIQRAKEVGVKKAIGASRWQLIIQFTGETILFALMSVIVALTVTLLLLPALNQFTGKNISLSLLSLPVISLIVVGLILVVGVSAGFYPAIVLSRFKAVKVLKGTTGDEGIFKGQLFRKALVVTQFSLSSLLIISAIIVYQQVNYLHTKDLGFNKEEIMFFPMQGDDMTKNYSSFKNGLLQSSGVSSVSIGYGFPGDLTAGDQIIVPSNGESKNYSVTQLLVDHDYIKTLNLQLVAGRDFSKDIKTDQPEGFIINETAVKELGFGTPQKAIGQKLEWKVWVSKTPDSLKKGRVIGVVKDFNYKNLYEKVNSAVIQIYPEAYWKVAVKLKTADAANTISYINNIWKKYSPGYPMDYTFMDENFKRMYQSEDKFRALLIIFTGLAIFIGCLGLFGLAAYTAERRTKEIGIRKILGADVNSIVMLLSGEFLKLILIALVIAAPLAWYFMNGWLKDFAYRIEIGWAVFVLAGVLAIVIAMLTVSYQGIKAALVNPVKNLRVE
jgi:putative ABC transport system permease protein